MTAPYDPNPTRDTHVLGRMYHWAWGRSRKGRLRILLHQGPTKGCKRVHYDSVGQKLKA